MPSGPNEKSLKKGTNSSRSKAQATTISRGVLVNSDQESLNQLRLLWQLGDWVALEALSAQDINGFDSRAEFALYISAACFQLGLLDKAKIYQTMALQWGTSKKDISRVLISGVYNTLANASIIAGESSISASLKHFVSAAEIALPGIAIDSLIKARTQNQLERLQNQAPHKHYVALELHASKKPVTLRNTSEQVRASIQANYNFDSTLNIWRRTDTHDFTYTDGSETEHRILSAVKSCKDVSIFSQELLQHQTDWASEYHFSADRVNLLRPFTNHFKDAQVLELGCGCGAITRFLGESGAAVTAIEGSQQRASIASERCRDLANVTIVLDKLQNAPFNQLFDVVTLIGVLEYSRIYVEAEDPIQYVLEKARSYLKPDGILIVAIENQLGLKYFAGAPEDHGVGVMSGINDVYGSKTPVTFGKQELERRFIKAGFTKCDTYLPFPDYKLPCLIVHPEGGNYQENFDLGNLLAGTVFYDRQGISNPLFSLEASWPLISRNGLTADLANSHLFIVHNTSSIWQSSKNILASYYSPMRSKNTSQEIIFHKHNNYVSVSRRRISASLDDTFTNEPYLNGVLHSQKLHQIVQRKGWSLGEIEQWVQLWLDALEKALVVDMQTPEGWTGYNKWLPANYIDALPRNLIVHNDGFSEFIDLEWTLPHPIPLPLVLYRGLVITLSTITSVAEPNDSELIQQQELLNHLMRYCGYTLSAADYALFVPLMEKLSKQAQGKLVSELLPYQAITLKPFKVRTASGIRAESSTCMTLYWRHTDSHFCEENTIKHHYLTNGKQQDVVLDLPPCSKSYTRLRLDIAERPGFYKIDEISLCDSNNGSLWSWDFNVVQLTNIGEISFFHSENEETICLLSQGYDPQFELDIPENLLEALSAGGSLRINIMAIA
jgi:2-polyprenyl-3-methyl-5-hydroxy-6-metoxy-1,4-benzoquinol methylase